MSPRRPINRQLRVSLILLSAVLVLGIVQWSFLPILIQTAPLPGRALLEISGNHTSKFAAPFKYLFVDSQKPCLARARVSLVRITSGFSYQLEEQPVLDRDDLFLSQRPSRAPPSA